MLARKLILIGDNANKYRFLKNLVKQGITINELIKTPTSIDRLLFTLLTEHNNDLHRYVHDTILLHGDNAELFVSPRLLKLSDLKELLEKRVHNQVIKDEFIDSSINKLVVGNVPVVILYAYFMEGLKPEIVMLRPDEKDNYSAEFYIQACQKYTSAVALKSNLLEYIKQAVTIGKNEIAQILYQDKLYDPLLLTVANSEIILRMSNNLYAAYPFKNERLPLPDLNRVIVDIYDNLIAESDLVQQLVPGYFIFKNKYRLETEALAILNWRDLLAHYVVQAAALEKYAFETIKKQMVADHFFQETDDIEEMKKEQEMENHRVLGSYTPQRVAKVLGLIKKYIIEEKTKIQVNEEIKNKIIQGLVIVEELLEKVNELNIDKLLEEDEKRSIAEQLVSNRRNVSPEKKMKIEVPKTFWQKIEILFSRIMNILFGTNAAVERTGNKNDLKKKSIEVKKTTSGLKENNLSASTLGYQNDKLLEDHINGAVYQSNRSLLSSLIVTAEELQKIKEKIVKGIKENKQLAALDKAKVNRRLQELLSFLAITLDNKRIKIDKLPLRYRNKDKIYIILVGQRPAELLRKLEEEYIDNYNGKADSFTKEFYVYVLRRATELIRSKK